MTNDIYINSKWDRRFLQLARHVSAWSKDPSTQVGAVITKENVIVSIGYNGLPRNVEDLPERYENRELKYKMIVHGEVNAIISAAQNLKNCTLYTWPFMPCSVCSGLVIQSGITRVVTPHNDNPRWKESFELTKTMFKEAGVVLDEYLSIEHLQE